MNSRLALLLIVGPAALFFLPSGTGYMSKLTQLSRSPGQAAVNIAPAICNGHLPYPWMALEGGKAWDWGGGGGGVGMTASVGISGAKRLGEGSV